MEALPWPSLFSIFFLFFKRGFLFMKKNFKLFSTIASLCLAVALMAFGVWAATSVSLGVTSKVSFTVSDVFVNITGKATLGGEDVASAAFTATSYTGTVANAKLDNETWAIGTIAFTSEKDVIVYTLEISNAAKSGQVKVTVTDFAPKAIAGTDATAKVVVAEAPEADLAGDAMTLAAGKKLTITVTRTLKDKTTTIEETDSWLPTIAIVNA